MGKDVKYEFGRGELKRMNDEKMITICKFNKKIFKHGEPVNLYVEIKNIKQLQVRVFEIQTENYYRKNLKDLEQTLNLDGLIATQESTLKFDQRPIQKIMKQLSFKTVTETKQGIFIIELIGNGISSRAIIKKGRLSLVQSFSHSGSKLTIIDENQEVCKGKRTGLWIKN